MKNDIICVILAGGLARRMGNIDKASVILNGDPLLSHVLNKMSPQAGEIIINANGDATRFAQWNLPVIADTIAEFPGPLAGVLAAMEWAQLQRPKVKWIASIPVDTPFAPSDLISQMLQSVTDNQADLACAKSNEQAHPVVGLWPVKLAKNLRKAMIDEGIRKVDIWTARFNLVHSEFSTDPIDPFFNINRPEDIKKAEEILQKVK